MFIVNGRRVQNPHPKACGHADDVDADLQASDTSLMMLTDHIDDLGSDPRHGSWPLKTLSKHGVLEETE